MKKHFIFLLSIIWTLTGCGGSNSSTESFDSSDSSFSSSIENQSDISSIESSFIESISSVDEESSEELSLIEVDDNTHYSSHEWDNNIVNIIEYVIGDAEEFIIPYGATKYNAYIQNEVQFDSYGNGYEVKSAHVVCLPVSLSRAAGEYETLLEDNGYYLSYESNYAFRKLSATDDLYVMYTTYDLTDTKGYATLDIAFYRITNRYEQWENEFAKELLGYEIPYYEAEAYEYYFEPTTLEGFIYCDVVEEDADVVYKDALINDGWVLKESTLYGYTLESEDGWSKISLYMTYTVYYELSLCIQMSNSWPLVLILGSLYQDLPKPNFGVYGGYSTNQLDDGTYYLGIYYDYCELTDYYSYLDVLSLDNWENYDLEDGTNPGNYESSNTRLGTVYYSYLSKKVGLTDVFVDIIYYSNPASLYIIVY